MESIKKEKFHKINQNKEEYNVDIQNVGESNFIEKDTINDINNIKKNFLDESFNINNNVNSSLDLENNSDNASNNNLSQSQSSVSSTSNLNLSQSDIFLPSSKSLWDIGCTILYTKYCHIVSIGLTIFLIFWILYFVGFMKKKNYPLTKLESEHTYFWLIVWMTCIIIVLLSWNFYLFIFISIYGYKYSSGSGRVKSSFAEEFYKSPFGFLILLYYFDNKILNNSIDNAVWMMLGVEYFFIQYNITEFCKQFDREVINIKKLTEKKKKKMFFKIKSFGILFGIFTIILTLFNYILVRTLSWPFKLVFISKGLFLIVKIAELLISRIGEFTFFISSMSDKEKLFLKNLKTKTLLELGTTSYIYYQIVVVLIYGECKPIYFTIVILFILVSSAYSIVISYKRYEDKNECFRIIDNSLKKVNLFNKNEECIICTEVMDEAKKLECGHNFHFICLLTWFEKGKTQCPLCRKKVKFSDNFNQIIMYPDADEDDNNNNRYGIQFYGIDDNRNTRRRNNNSFNALLPETLQRFLLENFGD